MKSTCKSQVAKHHRNSLENKSKLKLKSDILRFSLNLSCYGYKYLLISCVTLLKISSSELSQKYAFGPKFFISTFSDPKSTVCLSLKRAYVLYCYSQLFPLELSL